MSVGAIAGISVAGVIALVVILVTVLFVCKRKSSLKKSSSVNSLDVDKRSDKPMQHSNPSYKLDDEHTYGNVDYK